MLTKSRLTLATAIAIAALGAPPAVAMAATEDARQLDMHASSVERSDAGQSSGISDARGEHAASLSERTAPAAGLVDVRGDAAREPFVSPVVVQVDEPISTGFDWTAAIIGIGAGLALAVLAGVGVSGTRRRHPRTV